MSDINKALTPLESIDKVPVDSAQEFQADQKITFIFSANDMYMWLINDSYLSFDLSITRAAYSITNNTGLQIVANTPMSSSYIRNACNIFKYVRVKYAGTVIEYNPYHQIETFLRQFDFGESYLLSNFNTFTTTEMIKQGLAHLEFNNGKASAAIANGNAGNIATETYTIKNVVIPANILLPIFSDITAKGFPLGTLNNVLEIELFIAPPESYLVDYSPKYNDFSGNLWCANVANGIINYNVSAREITTFGNLATRYPTNSVKITKPNFHCKYYIPNENERAIIIDKSNNSGFKYRYFDYEIGTKTFNSIDSRNIIPFTIHTSNTKSIIAYCYRNTLSPMLMYRPYTNNVYLHMNGNDIPKQPISGDTYEYPIEYKYLVDDVFNNLDTYYSDTNNDLNKCYQYQASDGIYNRSIEKPTSSFILLGANFTTDPEDLGASSTRWQDTYQLHFSCEDITKNSSANSSATRDVLIFVLAIRKECGIIVKNGMIEQFDL